MNWHQKFGSAAALFFGLSCSPQYFVIRSDVDNDKLVDLVVGEESGDIYVLLNSPQQADPLQYQKIKVKINEKEEEFFLKKDGYNKHHIYSLREGLKALGVQDINNDGLEDIIAVDKAGDVWLFFNEGQRKFRMERQF